MPLDIPARDTPPADLEPPHMTTTYDGTETILFAVDRCGAPELRLAIGMELYFRRPASHYHEQAHEHATFDLLDDLADFPDLPQVDIDDTVWSFEPNGGGRFGQWTTTVLTPAAGFAARVGDMMSHGEPITPGPGSPNVLIGGRPALRSCDVHVCTRTTPEPHPSSAFVPTCTTVRINGFPALRLGDSVNEGPHGLNAIVTGCPSVVIGPKPPPVEHWSSEDAKPILPPAEHPFGWHRGELGPRDRKEVLGAQLDGPRVRAEGKTSAARLWAEATPEGAQR